MLRLLRTMEDRGYVERRGAAYALGAKLFALGNIAGADLDLRTRALPHLVALRDGTGETVQIASLDNWQVVYLERVLSEQPVAYMKSRAGTVLPAYCIGLGKVLLAHRPVDEVATWSRAQRFARLTPTTITTTAGLLAELASIRERGYAVDREEREPGVTCIAAPVRIVVVVSGGNHGRAHPRLSDPAMNPFVVAVGAADPHGTPKADDDTVPDFSSRGAPARRVDLTAPGQSIVSLRDPGSIADVEHPTARVGERFFRGSGTSQAAAVVSGAAALLLQQRPTLTPDQVKRLLVSTAMPMPRADAEGRGAGLVDVRRASDAAVPRYTQTWPQGSGTGTLEAARAGSNVDDQGVLLSGETDIFGRPWSSDTWAGAAAAETAWNAGAWLGTPYTGDSWGGTSFASTTWQARSWREADWAARSWRSDGWSARSWRSGSWSGSDWLSSGWSARSWRDASL